MNTHRSHTDGIAGACLTDAARRLAAPAPARRQFAYCECGARLTGDSLQALVDAAERHLAQHRHGSLFGAPLGADGAAG